MVLGIIGVVLLLALGGCVLVVRKGIGAVTAPVDASNQFLAAVANDETAKVTRLRCPDAAGTIADVRRLRQIGFDGTKSLRSSNIVNGTATVSGTIGTTNGTAPISLRLVHKGNGIGEQGWCVTDVNV